MPNFGLSGFLRSVRTHLQGLGHRGLRQSGFRSSVPVIVELLESRRLLSATTVTDGAASSSVETDAPTKITDTADVVPSTDTVDSSGTGDGLDIPLEDATNPDSELSSVGGVSETLNEDDGSGSLAGGLPVGGIDNFGQILVNPDGGGVYNGVGAGVPVDEPAVDNVDPDVNSPEVVVNTFDFPSAPGATDPTDDNPADVPVIYFGNIENVSGVETLAGNSGEVALDETADKTAPDGTLENEIATSDAVGVTQNQVSDQYTMAAIQAAAASQNGTGQNPASSGNLTFDADGALLQTLRQQATSAESNLSWIDEMPDTAVTSANDAQTPNPFTTATDLDGGAPTVIAGQDWFQANSIQLGVTDKLVDDVFTGSDSWI